MSDKGYLHFLLKIAPDMQLNILKYSKKIYIKLSLSADCQES